MTKKPRCPVCAGVGTIRWRIPRRLDTSEMMRNLRSADLASTEVVQDDIRTYLCPECAPAIDPARVMIVGATEMISHETEHRAGERYIEHMTEDLHQGLAIYMLRNKMVRVTRRELDPSKSEIRGEIGVVMPSVVKTIEDRIEERGAEISKAVVDEACAVFSRPPPQGKLVDFAWATWVVRNALETVLRARKKREV